MSKLEERVPALVTRQQRLELAGSVLDTVSEDDGRINHANLVNALEERIQVMDVNETLLVHEGRRSAALQVATAWANLVTIKIDRDQRLPVYQANLGFSRSFFKVGSEYVPADAMTTQDFEVMIERIDRRIGAAQTDRDVLNDFYVLAKPGLEAGENLVQQYESGKLTLFASDERDSVEAAIGDVLTEGGGEA